MMHKECTWEGCEAFAQHPMLAKDGEQWADLCDAHKAKFDSAVSAGNAGSILAIWVKAQGGAKAAAKRMTGRP